MLNGLRAARVALGVVFLVRTTPLVNLLPIPLARVRGPLLGWPEDGLAFAWGGLVLPPSLQIGAALVRTITALLFVLDVRPRASGLVAGVCGFVALSQDPFGFVFTLYALFLGTIVLALAVDVRLPRIFVVSVYVWSAIAKMQGEWLSGDTLRALAEDGLVAHVGHPSIVAWLVLLAEIALPCALLLPRTRRAALAVAVVFHVALEAAARPDVMGAVMLALLLVFRDPHAPDARPLRRSDA
jgi:hypothetical protein